MQGIHQKSELFTINPVLFPQPGPAQLEAHSGDSVEGLASLIFHSASPASYHGYDYCGSVGAVNRERGSNSCKLTSGFLARQMLNSPSFSPSALMPSPQVPHSASFSQISL